MYCLAATPRRMGNPWLACSASPKMNLGKNFCGQNGFTGLVNLSNPGTQFSNPATALESVNKMNRIALRTCLTGPVLRRSLKVALIIGTLLTAINQGDLIMAGQQPVIWKVALTYLVPFLVASYGAYSALAMRDY